VYTAEADQAAAPEQDPPLVDVGEAVDELVDGEEPVDPPMLLAIFVHLLLG
jgi:hypothetical protein